MKKGFTFTELIIVLALVAVLSAIIIPQFVSAYNRSKHEVADICNGKQVQIIDIETNEIIYQGENNNAILENYTVVDVKYGDFVKIFVKKKAASSRAKTVRLSCGQAC